MSSSSRHDARDRALTRRDASNLALDRLSSGDFAQDDQFDLRDILKVLLRRRTIILATVVVITGGVALVAFNLTPRYEAAAAIMIEPRESRVVDIESVIEGLPQDNSVIQTQISLLKSRAYAEQIVEQLDLLGEPEFNVALRAEERPAGMLERATAAITAWLPHGWLTATGLADPPGATSATGPEQPQDPPNGHQDRPAIDPPSEMRPAQWLVAAYHEATDWLHQRAGRLADVWRPQPAEQPSDGVPRPEAAPGDGARAAAPSRDMLVEQAAHTLLDNLDVRQFGESYILLVSYTSTDPRQAARIANRFTEAYIQDRLETKRVATDRAATWLSDRLAELREQVLEAETAVARYRAEHELPEGRGPTLNQQEQVALNRDLVIARTDRAEKRTKLELMRDLVARGEGLDSVAEAMASPVIANLRRQQVELLRQEAQLSKEYGPRHPRMEQLQADKANLAAEIDAEMQNILRNLENEVAVLDARVRTLERNLQQAQSTSDRRNQAEVRLRILEREAEASRSLYTSFLNRYKELTEQKGILEPGARVVSPASVPDQPSFPRPKLMVAAGFTGSLMLGTLLAFVRERLDTGLRNGQQIEAVLGVAHIGYVPRVKGIKRQSPLHHHVLKKPRSAYAEGVRSVHTTLYLSNVDDPPQVILVTSSLPGEGKTSLALSLGAAAASSGHKAVVVDLDLRRPSLAKTLHRRLSGPGLIEYMTERATLDEIIHAEPAHPNLDLLPIHRFAANPTDMLGSERLRSLIGELRQRYKYVFLDTAPVLGISDTKLAARLADVVVFAVRWGKTNEDVAANGLEALFESHASVAGAVLTQVDLRRHARSRYGDAVQYYDKYKSYYVD